MQEAQRGLLPIERPEPVSTEVARRLVDFLLSGQIRVGQRIPSERQLAKALGVGRSAIRDAIKPLQLLGLVEVKIGDGTYLTEADSALLPRVIEWGLLLKAGRTLELLETRRYVEVALAGLASERKDPVSIARLDGTLDRMRIAGDTDAFVLADTAFHLAIAEAAQNGVLAGILASIRPLLNVWMTRVVGSSTDTKALLAHHIAIHRAIRNGDRPAAEAAMSAHFDDVTSRLRATLTSPSDAPIAPSELC